MARKAKPTGSATVVVQAFRSAEHARAFTKRFDGVKGAVANIKYLFCVLGKDDALIKVCADSYEANDFAKLEAAVRGESLLVAGRFVAHVVH